MALNRGWSGKGVRRLRPLDGLHRESGPWPKRQCLQRTESVCYHPLLLFNGHGDCLAAKRVPVTCTAGKIEPTGCGQAGRSGGMQPLPSQRFMRLARRAVRHPHSGQQELGVRDPSVSCRGPAASRSRRYRSGSWKKPETIVAKAPELFARSVFRDEHELAKPVASQARHGGAVD